MPPAKKTIGLSELRVGLLVVISTALLIFLILNATGDINPFASKLHVRAQFANADGLRPGSEVRLAGVRVGKVEEVKLLPPSNAPTDSKDTPKVEARLTLDGKIDGRPANERIRTDSTAQLGSPGLLGNEKLINITPGTAIGQPIQENALLPASSATGFDQLTASGNELVQRLNRVSEQVSEITRKINEGQGSVGRLFNDDALYNNVNATFREANELANQIRAGQGTAGKFVNDPQLYNNANEIALRLRDISTQIQQGRGTAGKLLTDEALYNRANSAVARLDQAVNEIQDLVAGVRSGRGTVGKLFTDETVYNDARAAIARFNTTAERIDNVVITAQRGEGTLGKLLTDDKLYTNTNQTISEANKLIYDFRQNPKKYLTVKFELF